MKKYRDAGLGLLFIIVNQLVIIPFQIHLDAHSIDIPASILVMLAVSILASIANYMDDRVTHFYQTHARGAVDFLGRHMSLGFVVSFVLLNRDCITNAVDIARISGAFGKF